jgi:oxygen-independent coproporphyrinogen III oxidase
MRDQVASLALAERAVPRYTSYPTAPHFGPAVNDIIARRWLHELPATASLSLYLHVPFCSAMCSYCGCHTKVVRRREPLDLYAATLETEIAVLARATPARRAIHLHWGGGTPSLLGAANLRRVVTCLRECFDLSHLIEHAIELDPRNVDRPLVEALADVGVTRVSLGVQDVNNHVQRAIGRIQSAEIVAGAVCLLREAGIQAINFDLMYGLPSQSGDDIRRTCEFAVSLAPSRLTVFGYAHVPWLKSHQRLIDAAALPGAAARLEQADIARGVIEAGGYRAIGLDHYAGPDDPMTIACVNGMLRRNFQGYTVDAADALIPIGASSIGNLPQGYMQNAADVAGWRRAVMAGNIAVVRGIAFNTDDRLRARVIERLMCDFDVDYGATSRALIGNEAALDAAADDLDALQRQGILVHSQRQVHMTAAGRPFVRLAAAAFDAYLNRQAARHSVAI